MYAVIKSGGKQYKVGAESTLRVEKLPGDVGASVDLTEVLVAQADRGFPQRGDDPIALVGCRLLAFCQRHRVSNHILPHAPRPHRIGDGLIAMAGFQ